MNFLSVWFGLLQNAASDPTQDEINLALPLAGFLFCGLPFLIILGVIYFFLQDSRKRAQKLEQYADEQERKERKT